MGSSRRKFSKEFKLDAVQRLRVGEPAGLVARSLEVNRQELYRWSRDVDKFGERAFPGVGQKRMEETRIAELERKIGQQVLEIDFLKRALQHVEQQRQLRAASGGAPFTTSRARSEGRNSTRHSPDVYPDGSQPCGILPARS
jgi:transposase-like protein